MEMMAQSPFKQNRSLYSEM